MGALEAEEVGEVGISDKVEAEATATGAFLPVAVLRGGGPSHPGAAVAVVAPIPGLLHPLAPGLVLPLAPDKYWALLHPQTRCVVKKKRRNKNRTKLCGLLESVFLLLLFFCCFSFTATLPWPLA